VACRVSIVAACGTRFGAGSHASDFPACHCIRTAASLAKCAYGFPAVFRKAMFSTAKPRERGVPFVGRCPASRGQLQINVYRVMVDL
jgi:hypothetical protein